MNELEKMLEYISKREIGAVVAYAVSHNQDICVRDDESDWFWENHLWRAYPETYWIKEKIDAFNGREIIDIWTENKSICIEVK